jgi:two-component system, chemotaxis family, chemotaxis protein CheY
MLHNFISKKVTPMKYCLIVDDSPVIRKVARRILEGKNMRIEEAEDGNQALDLCRQTMPDAIFVDANMPNLDGYDFLRELRKMEKGTEPKVIICATENEVSAIARARHLGADNFILKPFDKNYLVEKFTETGIF